MKCHNYIVVFLKIEFNNRINFLSIVCCFAHHCNISHHANIRWIERGEFHSACHCIAEYRDFLFFRITKAVCRDDFKLGLADLCKTTDVVTPVSTRTLLITVYS